MNANRKVYFRGLFVLLFALIAHNLFAQQLYYKANIGEQFHMDGPDMGPYITVLACHYEASESGLFDIVGWNNSRGADVTILKYFYGEKTITCRYQYQWVKANGHYEVDWNTITYHISCNPVAVSLNKSEVSLRPGDTFQLSYSTTPYIKDFIVNFSSSDENVATVGLWDGLITAKGGGTCTITAVCNSGYKDPACKVTVVTEPPTDITIKPASATLAIGDTKQLTYSLTPSDAYTDVTWTTSSSSVATVSSSGYVTAKGVGTARITATTSNGLSSTCEVTVYKPVPSSIKLSENFLNIPVGNSETLTYSVSPSNAIYTTTWSSDNTAVATVNNSGTITAIAPGTAYVTVLTDNGYSDRCMVQVPPLPESIALPANIKMGLGKTYQLPLNVYPTDAISSYTWCSSDLTIASVNSNGIVTGRGVGTAVITVKSANGLVANCNVTVPTPQYVLVVWTTDGERMEFPFAEDPQVTIHDKVFTVSSQLTTMEFEANDNLRFTLEEKSNPTKINEINGNHVDEDVQMQMMSERLVLSSCKPGSKVSVYSLGGRIVENHRVGSDGQVAFSLAGYASGIYIIKIGKTNFKIIKK